MKIGIPKEIHPGEKRVATTPEAAAQIISSAFPLASKAARGWPRIFPMRPTRKSASKS